MTTIDSQLLNVTTFINKLGFIPGRRKLAKLMGITEDRARNLLSKYRTSADIKSHSDTTHTESREISGDKYNVTLPKTSIHTLEQLIAYCEVDMKTWQVERFVCNKYEMSAKDNDGNIQTTPLYQVKATFVRAKGLTVEAVREEIKYIKELACSEISSFNINKKLKTNSNRNNALECNIADIHCGKLAWGVETLGANYDHKIAAKLYQNAFLDIFQRTTVPLDRILLLLGNDFYHSDQRSGTTTRGTQLDNDSRFHKTFRVGFDLIVKQINTALEIAPVDVLMVSGNHDELSVWHLGHSLECLYSGNKNVKIDNSPAYRKYWQYGVNMIMGTHGNDIKHTSLPILMATEMPKMWSETKYREIHLGHKHTTAVSEDHGVITRIVPSLTPPDWWHSQMGYTSNIRAAQGFVYGFNDGLLETKEHYIDRLAE